MDIDKNQTGGNAITENTVGNKKDQTLKPSQLKNDRCCYKETEISVTFYDTPLFEEVVEDETLNRQGFHAIALLLPLTRFTEERKKFFKQVSKAFDQSIWQYVIIVLTHNKNQGGVDEIKEEINKAGSKIINDFITRSGERYVLFEPTGNEKEIALPFTEKLMDVVDQTKYKRIYLRRESFGRRIFKRFRLDRVYSMLAGEST